MTSTVNRYFIAVVLPSPLGEQANELKCHFRDHYKSKASLNSPPHITLHMPFEWKAEKEDELIRELQGLSTKLNSIKIELENFGCFPPCVVYINVKRTKELEDLQLSVRQFCKRQLGLFNSDYKDLPFHPHITLAFRDLKKSEFLKGWEEFKDRTFEGSFIAHNIYLLKFLERKWNVLRELPLTPIEASSKP